MKQNLWTIYCCILFLIVPMIVPTYAFANGIKGDQFEDENSPISFKIELLPWDQVDEILPKFSVFTIIDVETGLSFKVQRRAGNHHADVQPLSFKDTKVMKKIYNNKWSWNRRAILILKDDQIIAASMHGMPHGAGTLRNGFPGHFCVHFWESTTHKRDKMDLAHQMMILKAAGKIDDYLENVDPLALINIFAVAVNNHDHFLLKETVAKNTYQSKLRKKMIKDISYISLINIPNITNKAFQDLLAIEIPVKVEFHSKKKGKTKKVIPFLIRRDSLIDRWYIEGQTLLKEFS